MDDVVESRHVVGPPDPGAAMVEREAIRVAVEKAQAMRPRRHDRPDLDDLTHREGDGLRPPTPLPEDLATALQHVDALVDMAQATLTDLRTAVQAVRARAERDADLTAKLKTIAKTLASADLE